MRRKTELEAYEETDFLPLFVFHALAKSKVKLTVLKRLAIYGVKLIDSLGLPSVVNIGKKSGKATLQ